MRDTGEMARRSHAHLPEHGQSFSAELQREVERSFELAERVELPNWPCCLDALMVWRRRPPEELD